MTSNPGWFSPRRLAGLLVLLDRSGPVAAGLAVLAVLWALGQALLLPDPFTGHGHFILNKPIDNKYMPYRMDWGRPLEECSTLEADKDRIMARFGENIQAAHRRFGSALAQAGPLARWPLLADKARTVLGIYHATSNELRGMHDTPCPGEWIPHNNFELIHKWFLTEAPYIWLMINHRVTPLEVDVGMRVVQALAVACLFLAVRRMARSSLAGLAALAVLSGLTQWPGGDWYDTFLLAFPLVYLGQLLADPDLAPERSRALRAALVALLGLLFGLAAVATWFCYPPQNRVAHLLMMGAVALVAVVRRRPALLVRVAVMWLVVKVVTAPIIGVGDLFAPAAGVNHVTNSGFAKMSAFIGQCERPNPYGLPLADLATVDDPMMFDPLLTMMKQDFIMHQSEGHYGGQFLKDMVLRHPGAFLETYWKRLFLHFAYPEVFIELFLNGARQGTLALWWLSAAALAAAMLCAVFTRRDLAGVLPPILAALWAYLGIHVVLFYFHAHDYYTRGGAYTFLCLLPGLAGHLVSVRRDMAAALGRLAAAAGRAWRRAGPVLGTGGLAALLVLAAFAGRYFVREARKEVHSFHVIYPLLNGFTRSPEGMTPNEIEARVEAIRALGGNRPGEVEMWGAQVFYTMRVWRYRTDNPPPDWFPAGMDRALIPAYNVRARELTEKYFRLAQAEAPDNPYFPVYAQRLELPGWEGIFWQALQRHPDLPFAAYMAKTLFFGAPLSPEQQNAAAEILVRNIGRLLLETAQLRPGFRHLPGFAQPPKATPRDVARGIELTLAPGERVVLEGSRTFGSTQMCLALFFDVLEGSAGIGVAEYDGRPCGVMRTGLGTPESGQYLIFDVGTDGQAKTVHVVIAAGEGGAKLVLRDLYPLALRPNLGRPARG